jgi:carbohydrate-binding DOMON domain-containing protein
MAANFQSAVTFVLMKFFSKFLLHFACFENGENLWKKFFHFGQKLFHFYIHRGGGGQRIISISVLNDRAENFTQEKHV